MTHQRLMTVFVLALALAVPGLAAAPPRTSQEDVAALLDRFQSAVQQGDREAFVALLAPGARRADALVFANAVFVGHAATKVTVRERDRVPLRDTPPDLGLRLAVDALVEQGAQARIHSWQIDVVRTRAPADDAPSPWQIQRLEQLSFLEGLERLSVDTTVQYRTRQLVMKTEDAQLRLPDGVVYVVRSGDGITGAVLIGQGDLLFRPSSAVERGQVKIFSGQEALAARFDAAYVRFAPGDAERLLPPSELVAEAVDPKHLNRASAVFREDAPKSYVVDLSEFDAGNWWVRPQPRDVVAEIRTRKFGVLTYAHAWRDHENVSLFDRSRKRHVSVYASASKLAERGRFYDESDGREYRVDHYDIDAALSPAAQWISAFARLRLTVLQDGVNRLTLRLAEPLTIASIATAEHGRLLGFRARGRNSVVVSFPRPLMKGQEVSLAVEYSGTLTYQVPGQDVVQFPQDDMRDEAAMAQMPLEPSFLYSQRSFWYPQATEPGFATATMKIRVPSDYACVGSGVLAAGEPLTMGVVSSKDPADSQHFYSFIVDRPVRYLALVVSRFYRMSAGEIRLATTDAPIELAPPSSHGEAGAPDDGVSLEVWAEVTRRFRLRAQKLMGQASNMARVYTQLAGGCPYPSLTLAMIEGNLPGGHSPAYFSVVNQVLPSAARPRRSWAGDPAAFADFPEYVLAHEVAHQWWGGAVGTKNYHEQWISEGFAQYFAALYAERTYGPVAYRTIIRQLARWARDKSDQGPIFLGSRLGHIQGDSRVFRAIVYNKGALVLHMLRQLLGDDVFFRGIARFYSEFRYRKAGTDDVQRVFEAEAGRSLQQFFVGWVYGQELPKLTVSTSTETGADSPVVVVRLSQQGSFFDVPVPVVLDFEDGSSLTVIVPLTGPTARRVIPIDRPLKRVSVSDAELAATVHTG